MRSRPLESLANIEAALVKETKGRFDLRPLLRGHAGASQPDYVQAGDLATTRSEAERRNILPVFRASLRDGKPSYADMLMEDAGAAKKCPVSDGNIAAKEAVVRDDDSVAERTIVAEVRAGHEKVIVADARRRTGRSAAMNRDMFANGVPVPDLHRAARLRLETQVLWPAADDRAVSDSIVFAEPDSAFDDSVRLYDGTRTDFHFAADARVGTNLDSLTQMRASLDECSRMNPIHSAPISLKLK